MTTPLRLVLLYLCWSVVLVRLSALRHKQQRSLWFALLMLGIGITMQQQPAAQVIARLAGQRDAPSLLSSLMAVGVATTLLTFTVRARQAETAGRIPYARLRLAMCVFTVVTMIGTFALVTASHLPTRDRFLPVPGTLTAHSVYWATYLVYMLVVTAVTTGLLWRTVPGVGSWLIRTPVLLLAVATSTFLAFLSSRVVAVFTYSSLPVVSGTYISSIHTTCVALGCSIAAFIPMGKDLAARRDCNALYPLWRALCDALPHIALYPPRSRMADALTPRNSQLRLHRRLIEIRDGLLIMRDWVSQRDLDAIREVIRDADLPADLAPAAITACWLKTALRAREAGLQHMENPLDLAREGGTDIGSELDWLRRVATAWSAPVVDRCSSLVSARRTEYPPTRTVPADT